MNTAKFDEKNGIGILLCSECSKIIKTEYNFNRVEKYAYEGLVSMLPRYCSEHAYKGMSGKDKAREMRQKGIEEFKKIIKNKLREGIMRKNVLNVPVTRPNQILTIMRGVSGSGKSTKAKQIVGEGVIHSTDDVIKDITGNYDDFFKGMVESGDFSRLSEMHNKNLLNAKKSMESGVSNVVIDNTNIKASEPKKYVEEALKLGYDENNIKIIDVGSGGETVKTLSERNTHGVPLKKIKKMVASHKGVGPLTVKKILEAKDMDKRNDVLYSAVVLDDESRDRLVKTFALDLPEGWKIIAHHMTIVFGKGLEDKTEIGKEVELTVTKLGLSDLAMAVKVDGYPSANAIPHVTVAVNAAEGGKPFFSNRITNWSEVELGYKLKLYGTVTEIKK